MPQVYNKYHGVIPHNSVYIGRPSKWGNPFEIGVAGTREEVIAKYRDKILSDTAFLMMVKSELKGKNLVCFCSPKSCHGDVLLEIANSGVNNNG